MIIIEHSQFLRNYVSCEASFIELVRVVISVFHVVNNFVFFRYVYIPSLYQPCLIPHKLVIFDIFANVRPRKKHISSPFMIKAHVNKKSHRNPSKEWKKLHVTCLQIPFNICEGYFEISCYPHQTYSNYLL